MMLDLLYDVVLCSDILIEFDPSFDLSGCRSLEVDESPAAVGPFEASAFRPDSSGCSALGSRNCPAMLLRALDRFERLVRFLFVKTLPTNDFDEDSDSAKAHG